MKYLVKAQGRYIGECSLFASEQKTARRFKSKAAALAEILRRRGADRVGCEIVRLLPKRYVVKLGDLYAGRSRWVKGQRKAFVFVGDKAFARSHAARNDGARVVRVRRKEK